MTKKMTGVLDVYPGRPGQKAVSTVDLFTERSSRRRGGVIFVKDQYTNQLVSFRTTVPKGQKDQKPVKKIAKAKKIRKKIIRPSEPDDVIPDAEILNVDLRSSASDQNPPQDDVDSLFVFGRRAIEYEHFDFSEIITALKRLRTFQPLPDELLLRTLKLSDREDTIGLKTTSQMRVFYEQQLIPAVENLNKFETMAEEFFDRNAGQYERYLSVDGLIVEIPMPARPEIFPAQIERRNFATRLVEHERRQDEEAAKVTAQIQQDHHNAYIRIRQEMIHQQQIFAAQVSQLMAQNQFRMF